MEGKVVSDWMHRGVVTCSPDTPVEEVAGVMEANDISALVVINLEGDAIGVISRTDLVNARFIEPYLKHWPGLAAEHLMSKPVISVTPETTVTMAAKMLDDRRVHRLVVVEETNGHRKPVGILSVTDLARHVGE
jgi:CBS domain-containing protein